MCHRRISKLAAVGLAVLSLSPSLLLADCGGGGSTTDHGQTDGTDGCPAAGPGGTWLRVVGGANEVFNTSVIQTADCGYLTAGYVRGGTTDLMLGKLEPSGATAWTKQYTSSRNREAILGPSGFESISHERLQGRFLYWVDTVAMKDGGAALVSDSLLMVVSKDGAPVWSRQYVPSGGSRHDVAFSSLVKVDGGFILQGVHSTTVPNTDVVLMKVDDGGKLVWAREFPDLRSGMNAPVLITDDGHLLIGGYVTGAKGIQKAAVMKLSLDGGVAWVRTVQMEDWREGDKTARSFGFQTMAQASNGDIILVQGYPAAPGFGNDTHGALISRLGPDGSHKWSKQFHYSRAGGETTINQVQADGAELLIAGGSTGFQYPSGGNWLNYNAFLAKMNENGDPISVRTLGKTDYTGSQFDYSEDYASGFVVTPDHRLLLTGYTNSFSTPQPFSRYQAPSHFDSFAALADANGMVHGLGDLTNTPDLGDDTEVWSKGVTAHDESVDLKSTVFTITVEDVTYTASDARLQERELPSEDGVPLELTYKPADKELLSNVSMFEDAAKDLDGDTIKQDWENTALQILNPIFVVDEEEDWLENREEHHVANFVRVTPWPSADDHRYILFHYAVTWSADYGGFITGSPFTAAEDHRGDVEKVVIATKVIGERRVKVEWVLTSAHGENTHTGVWHVTDRTCSHAIIAGKGGEPWSSETMCGKLQFSKGQLVVQASEDKHAIYPSEDVCESVTLVSLPGEDWGEDCGWQPSDIPVYSKFQWKESDFNDDSRYRGQGHWQFNAYNVGEPRARYQLIDDLDWPQWWQGLTPKQVETLTGLFPGETVWEGRTTHNDSKTGFCGGLDADMVKWFVNPDRCIGAPGGSLEVTEQLTDQLKSSYRVAITTANKPGAGTDAAVGVFLHGPRGVTGWIVEGTFEKGDTDVVHMGTHDVGPMATVVLSHDNAGDDPPWLVTKVTVQRKMTAEEWAWTSAGGVWVRGPEVQFTLTPQ